MSSSVSPEEQDSSVSNFEDTSQPMPSGRRTRHRRKAASTTLFGPESFPLAATPSGLTPDQQRARRSSIQLPDRDGGHPSNTDSTCPEAHEEVEVEIETPTRKRTRRERPKSSVLNSLGGSSPLRQTLTPDANVSSDQNEITNARSTLESSQTSPDILEQAKRMRKRPNVTERSASEPVTPGRKLSAFQLDDDIAQMIKDGPQMNKGKDKENGSIYLYKVRPRGSEMWLLKIGRTQKHVKGRLGQIRGACGHLEIQEHSRAVARDVPFHGLAEKLIHMELGNYQHQWLCDCGTRHREYFLVSDDIAVRVFERWRDFCQEKPWDPNGKILPKWAQRLQNRARFNGEEREFDHHEFARRWSAFTAPMSFERFLSDAVRVWRLAYPNRWMIISLAELLTIVGTSRHSFWASIWTSIIIVLLLGDLVVTENMHATASISQLMEGGLQSFSLQQKPPEDTTVAETQSPATGSSPEYAPRQQDREEMATQLGGSSASASNRSQLDIRQATDGDNGDETSDFTDDNNDDDWITSFRSPASLNTDSTPQHSA